MGQNSHGSLALLAMLLHGKPSLGVGSAAVPATDLSAVARIYDLADDAA